MYDLWFPSQPPTTRPIILVGTNRQDLDEHDWNGPNFNTMLDHLGPIQSREVLRDGKLLRYLYYRIAQGYLGFPHTQASVIPGQSE